MNITLENVDQVSAVITVKMEKADYAEKVQKSLKNIRGKVSMHGFRPGKVPAGMVAKMYGTQVKAEEVDKLLSESVSKYISDNNIKMLGNPLPAENHEPQDIEKQDDFVFSFDIALAPEININLSADDKIDFYNIEVSDEKINEQMNRMAQQAGQNVSVESYQDNDLVRGKLVELGENKEPKSDGVVVEKASVMPKFFKDEEQKKLFENAKPGDVVTLELGKAYDNNETELASLLHIEKENVKEHCGTYSFEISEISRFQAAEINQELFDRYYGKDVVKSVEEFKEKIKDFLKVQFDENSNYKFLIDLKKYMEDKVGNLTFPDALLKRIMLTNSSELDENKVEENYEKSIEALKWSLIKNELAKQLDIKITDEILLAAAKDMTRMQFAQYGMNNIPEEYIDQYAKEMLKKQDQVSQLFEHCVEREIGKKIKDKITLETKNVSLEDFNKMFE